MMNENSLYDSEPVKNVRKNLHQLSGAVQDIFTTVILVEKYFDREGKEEYCKKSLKAAVDIQAETIKAIENMRKELKELKKRTL